VNSLQAKHAVEMSKAEARHKAKVDALMEEVEKLRLDNERTAADIHEAKEKEVAGLQDAVTALQKQNETVTSH